MTHHSLVLGFAALTALGAQSCATTRSGGGTQTNWICETDDDCTGMSRCVGKRCVTEPVDATAHPPKSAEPTEAAVPADAPDDRTGFPRGAIATYGESVPGTRGMFLLVYPPGATSATPPMAAFESEVYIGSLAFDRRGNLYVASSNEPGKPSHVSIFTPRDIGNAGPSMTIDASRFGFAADQLGSIAVDSSGYLYMVRLPSATTDAGASPPAVVVLEVGNGTDARIVRDIEGDQTSIVDHSQAGSNHEIVIGSGGRLAVPQENQVLIFAPSADGNVAPVQSLSTESAAAVAVDPAFYLYVSHGAANSISVFDAALDPDPVRTISGPLTGLDTPVSMAVDGTGRLLVAPLAVISQMQVFPANASGNVQPVLGIRSAWGYVAVAP